MLNDDQRNLAIHALETLRASIDDNTRINETIAALRNHTPDMRERDELDFSENMSQNYLDDRCNSLREVLDERDASLEPLRAEIERIERLFEKASLEWESASALLKALQRTECDLAVHEDNVEDYLTEVWDANYDKPSWAVLDMRASVRSFQNETADVHIAGETFYLAYEV